MSEGLDIRELATEQGGHTPEQLREMKLGRAEIWLANAKAVQDGKLFEIGMAHQNITVTPKNATRVIADILADHPELADEAK